MLAVGPATLVRREFADAAAANHPGEPGLAHEALDALSPGADAVLGRRPRRSPPCRTGTTGFRPGADSRNLVAVSGMTLAGSVLLTEV
jgi:hypothetical protein